MAMKAEHAEVEPLSNGPFALIIDGLVKFVLYDVDACRQRAEMILLSKRSNKAPHDQALASAIRRL